MSNLPTVDILSKCGDSIGGPRAAPSNLGTFDILSKCGDSISGGLSHEQVLLCGGIVTAGSTQTIPLITNAPTKATKHTGQLKNIPRYHQHSDKVK